MCRCGLGFSRGGRRGEADLIDRRHHSTLRVRASYLRVIKYSVRSLSLDPGFFTDLKEIREGCFETGLCVVGENILPGREQALHLRIRLRDKFDNEMRRQIGKEAGDLAQRGVVADCKVVNQRERQHRVALGSLGEAIALPVAPTDGRGRGGEILKQGQDIVRPPCLSLTVLRLNCHRVDILRNHLSAVLRGDLTV